MYTIINGLVAFISVVIMKKLRLEVGQWAGDVSEICRSKPDQNNDGEVTLPNPIIGNMCRFIRGDKPTLLLNRIDVPTIVNDGCSGKYCQI